MNVSVENLLRFRLIDVDQVFPEEAEEGQEEQWPGARDQRGMFLVDCSE